MFVKDAIPRPALLLGWAGVIPFALLTAAIVLGVEVSSGATPASDYPDLPAPVGYLAFVTCSRKSLR